MNNEPPRIRVAAYVICHQTSPQLLVFEHHGVPEAGTQIPAGGVRPGATLSHAVQQEVLEATGLAATVIVNSVNTEDKPHRRTGQPRAPPTSTCTLQQLFPTVGPIASAAMGYDASLIFVCRLQPLPLDSPLADQQNAWLG